MNSVTSQLLHPTITHRLGAVVQFIDHFTGLPIRTPLRASIPDQRWDAIRSESDLTYRFIRTHREIPTGSFDVVVECPSGEYERIEQVTITLPIVVGHPPPIVRDDYLSRFPLWPTRRLRPEVGETVVTGRVLHTAPPLAPAVGMRVRLSTPVIPPAGTAYAYTNAQGEFVYRLPGLRMSISGGIPVTTATLNVEIRDAADVAGFPANPSTIVVRLGETNEATIEIP